MNPDFPVHTQAQASNSYCGRFAPSPTGDLHPGSLVAALGSLLDARSHQGSWLLRVEDIDPPREVEGSAEGLLRDLNSMGFQTDQPPLFQSQRSKYYQAAIDHLLGRDQAYWCGCTRSDLPASGIYPGTCRDGLPAGRRPRAIRIRVDQQPIEFSDRLQGTQRECLPKTTGDFVIRRADGHHAYQLAVVVDDAFQGVSHVVRGADLLDSTARQIHLQRLLGLPVPTYMHLPLVLGEDGGKLAMSRQSSRLLDPDPLQQLLQSMAFLGFEPDERLADLKQFWRWAIRVWDCSRIDARNRPWPVGVRPD